MIPKIKATYTKIHINTRLNYFFIIKKIVKDENRKGLENKKNVVRKIR